MKRFSGKQSSSILILLRICTAIGLLFLAPGFAKAFYLFGLRALSTAWFPLGVGLLAGAAFEKQFLRRFPVVAALEHEITHAVAGIPFGFFPYKILVNKSGNGECRQFGICPVFLMPFALDWITLAPYVLPTMTMALVFLRPVSWGTEIIFYDILVGMSLGYHTTSTLKELVENWKTDAFRSCSGRIMQTDIAKVGVVYAAIFIPTVTLALHGLCLAVYFHGTGGVGQWWQVVLSWSG